MGTVAALPGQRNRRVDGGMGGNFQEQELARPEAQKIPHAAGFAGQRTVQAMVDEGVDLAQTAQHRARQVASEGAVAGWQPR